MKLYSWDEVQERRSKLSKAERDAIKAEVAAEVERMRVPDLRSARWLTHAAIAETLGIAPVDIARVEQKADLYVSTLRRFVEEYGGTLRVVVNFPGAEPIEVQPEGFRDLEPPGPEGDSLNPSIPLPTGADIERARERGREEAQRGAVSARYDRDADVIVLELRSGATVTIPRKQLPGLDENDVADVTVSPGGTYVEFPAVEVWYWVADLIRKLS